MCMIQDADSWKFFHSKEVTSRKTWKCVDCYRTIQPGERYHYATGLLAGAKTWDQLRQCMHCHIAAEWLFVICHGWVYGGILEDLQEHWDEYPSRALARLTSGIKVKWHGGRDPLPEWAGDAAIEALEAQRRQVHTGLTLVGKTRITS